MPGHKSNQDASIRKGEYFQASGDGTVLNRSTAPAETGLVKCPFCNKQVKTKQLADHARQFHSGEAKRVCETSPPLFLIVDKQKVACCIYETS